MKIINCNPSELLPAPAGIENFYWPDTPEQFNAIQKLAEAFLLAQLERTEYKSATPLTGGELACLFGPIWMQLLAKLFMAAASDVKKMQNFRLHYASALYPFWADYHNGHTLKDQPSISLLVEGPQSQKCVWRWLPRIIRTLWRRDEIKRYPYIFFKPDRHTAFTSNLQVNRDFCRAHSLNGLYLDPEFFFSKIPEDALRETPAETLLIDSLHQGLLSCLETHAIIRPQGRLWLRRQIAITVIYAQRYVAQLLNRTDILPRNLVSNLGGTWNGLLRYAVKKSGGTVHVIDHGGGSAIFKTPLVSMTNYSGTSIFYAFTTLSRDLLVKNFPQGVRPVLGSTRIEIFPHADNQRIKPVTPNKTTEKKSVLVVPLSPLFDRGLMCPYPGTCATVDFNARLLSALKSAGWHVAVKPHPAFMEFDSALYPEKYGVTCETRPFEDVFDKYDALVNCDFSSTILASCLYSEKPLILMNTNPDYYDEDAIALLAGRAEIINFSYSETGRVRLDSDVLANMLKTAILKTHNTDFIPLFQES